VKCEIR